MTVTDLEYLEIVRSRLVSLEEARLDPTWDRFLYGSAGSLVLICPNCGDRIFRDPFLLITFTIKKHYCVHCSTELQTILAKPRPSV